jgi:hypothetical protein
LQNCVPEDTAPTLGRFSYLINMEQVFGTHNHLLTLLIVIMGGPQRMIATRRCSPRTSSEAANEITK